MLKTLLSHIFPEDYQSYSQLSGGDINDVVRVQLKDGSKNVVKINLASKFPKMLSKFKNRPSEY